MELKNSIIQKRLMRVILLTSGTVLTLSCAGYFLYEYTTFRKNTIEQVDILAKVLAANSTAPLAFDDKENANEILNALKVDEHIVAASLYDKEGNIFATYPGGLPQSSFPAHPLPEGYRFENGHLLEFQPVTEGNARLGTIYLNSDMKVMYDHLKLYGIIICVVIVVSFGLAYILSKRLRETILKPVFSLAKTARVISEKGDYSVRAIKYGEDEFGSLTDAFNNMLDRIEAQNEEIISFNQNLERKVSDRTSDLENANIVLKEQKEFVETIINASVDTIGVFNKNLEYVVVNKHALDIYKVSKEDIIGKNILEIFPSVRNSGMHEDLSKALNGESIHKSNYRSPVLNRYFENYYIPLKDSNNKVYGIVAIGHDITDIREANEKLQIINSELVKSNHDLEQYAYIASHDLQEPLRKIQVFSDLAEKYIDDKGAVKKYFEKINSSAKRMSDLIRSVLNYSRLSKMGHVFSPVDLNGVLESIKTDLELIINEKNAVIINNDLGHIDGIPLQLNQLFYNLIINSLKFCDKRPEINIQSRTVPADEVINNLQINKETLSTREQFIELIFKDNGIGFEPKYSTQIFTIFQRLHDKYLYPGTGIGLALCKKIVENHGGYISVKSELGKGAAFYIYLPVTHHQDRKEFNVAFENNEIKI